VISATRRGRRAADLYWMRYLAPIVAVVCLAACAKPIELSHTIQPSRAIAGKSSERAGVVCSENLLGHVERASYYEIALGEPLCNALVKSVEGTYRAAQRATKAPYAGEYGRVVRFDLQSSPLGIQRQPGGAIRVSCAISIIVERFGRDLKRVSSQAVTGYGLVERADATDVVVKEAVEAALQQVTDNASSLLIAGVDGPRQHGPSAEP
jgi:hypothetical protein